MGEWVIWLVIAALMLVLFCIYSLSSQLERSIHLAVEIIGGHQRRILERLDEMAAAGTARPVGQANVIPFERRIAQRRRSPVPVPGETLGERRRTGGRRRDDLVRQAG